MRSNVPYLFFLFTLTLSAALPLSAAEGLHKLESAQDVETTADRLEKSLREKGLKVFIRIDYAAGAKKAGMQLRPMQSLVFGNPKLGTHLMNCRQDIAIDLPMKALIYQGEQGRVWLTYNDPHWLAKRHELGDCGAAIIQKMSAALDRLAHAATKP